MNFTEKIEEILQKEAQAILDIPVTDQFEKAVELIVEQVHRKGGKLVTSGMGKAGQIAMNIATTFCSTGTPAVFLHPSEAQHGDLGILQKNDLMLVISNSGENSRNTRTSSTGFEPDARIEIHRHYREQPKRTRPTCRRMPFYRSPGRSMPTRADTDDLDHAYDGYRRYSGRRRYGGDSFRRPSICPASPRRILGNPFQRTKSE